MMHGLLAQMARVMSMQQILIRARLDDLGYEDGVIPFLFLVQLTAEPEHRLMHHQILPPAR
ncbi:MAG: hypothetical protein JO172_03420 [Hyphomicrobiales bacterium]|nr:hypothetical protein [Hyphomicrobiales bacterium]